MLDTTIDMQEKQLEIILAKSPKERASMGVDMIDFAYQTVKRSILIENPTLSEREVVIEIFKRYYSNDFSPKQLSIIIEQMKNAV